MLNFLDNMAFAPWLVCKQLWRSLQIRQAWIVFVTTWYSTVCYFTACLKIRLIWIFDEKHCFNTSICMPLQVNGMQIGHQKDAYRAANAMFLLKNTFFPPCQSPVLHPASLLIFSILQVLKPCFWGVFRVKYFTFVERDYSLGLSTCHHVPKHIGPWLSTFRHADGSTGVINFASTGKNFPCG